MLLLLPLLLLVPFTEVSKARWNQANTDDNLLRSASPLTVSTLYMAHDTHSWASETKEDVIRLEGGGLTDTARQQEKAASKMVEVMSDILDDDVEVMEVVEVVED